MFHGCENRREALHRCEKSREDFRENTREDGHRLHCVNIGVDIGVETCEKGPGVNIDVRYNSHCTLVWTLACTLV